MFTSALSPEQREEALRQLADETFDILVIGGESQASEQH